MLAWGQDISPPRTHSVLAYPPTVSSPLVFSWRIAFNEKVTTGRHVFQFLIALRYPLVGSAKKRQPYLCLVIRLTYIEFAYGIYFLFLLEVHY